MYIDIRKPRRRGVAGTGLGWTGGFTIPGNTTRYSTEKCTGSAAVPMTNGDIICGMPGEQEYLNSIGCTAIGFNGSHTCQTDAGNQGAFFCCPEGSLQRELDRSSIFGVRVGISKEQLVGIVGLAAIIGVAGYMIWKSKSKSIPMEEELWEPEY